MSDNRIPQPVLTDLATIRQIIDGIKSRFSIDPEIIDTVIGCWRNISSIAFKELRLLESWLVANNYFKESFCVARVLKSAGYVDYE